MDRCDVTNPRVTYECALQAQHKAQLFILNPKSVFLTCIWHSRTFEVKFAYVAWQSWQTCLHLVELTWVWLCKIWSGFMTSFNIIHVYKHRYMKYSPPQKCFHSSYCDLQTVDGWDWQECLPRRRRVQRLLRVRSWHLCGSREWKKPLKSVLIAEARESCRRVQIVHHLAQQVGWRPLFQDSVERSDTYCYLFSSQRLSRSDQKFSWYNCFVCEKSAQNINCLFPAWLFRWRAVCRSPY